MTHWKFEKKLSFYISVVNIVGRDSLSFAISSYKLLLGDLDEFMDNSQINTAFERG